MTRERYRVSLIVCVLTAGSWAAAAERATLLTSDEAERLVGEIVPQVEELRGLAFKQTVPVEVVGNAALRDHVMTRLEAFDQLEHLQTVQQVYAILGLVPEGTDVLEQLLDALEEQAGGYYDPVGKAYYLLESVPSVAAPIFTAHELTHALEDQHFDLERQMRQSIDNDDELLAVSAVREGSATILMGVYMAGALLRGEMDAESITALAETEAGRAASLTSLPEVLLRQLLGPYILGANFLSRGNLLAVATRFPTDAVDRAMRERPFSSEQILHPEKYWDDGQRDDPTQVKLRGVGKVLGKKWSRVGTGVFGELTLGPLVGAETPLRPGEMTLPDASQWTNAAAAGWGGDRWELWRGEQGVVVVWLTEWDTETDASEFTEALASRDNLRWRQDVRRVAIVAGDATDKTERLLARMLR